MSIKIELLILLMAVTTFGCRYLFFMKSLPLTLGTRSKQLLKYTAPSVLTAMWVPIVFLGHNSLEHTLFSSPFFYGGVITLIVSLKVKNAFLVVATGMASFSLLNWLI
ncbi:AzlD domain-containing protein [Oceanisphaera sp. KMM 10153]|uniref:AzlD domain-containing protein n=1 Tax=Oceanisphaera submarina TaxID=3390193 RepID=UPI0039748036